MSRATIARPARRRRRLRRVGDKPGGRASREAHRAGSRSTPTASKGWHRGRPRRAAHQRRPGLPAVQIDAIRSRRQARSRQYRRLAGLFQTKQPSGIHRSQHADLRRVRRAAQPRHRAEVFGEPARACGSSAASPTSTAELLSTAGGAMMATTASACRVTRSTSARSGTVVPAGGHPRRTRHPYGLAIPRPGEHANVSEVDAPRFRRALRTEIENRTVVFRANVENVTNKPIGPPRTAAICCGRAADG